jgi:biotin operon repressor
MPVDGLFSQSLPNIHLAPEGSTRRVDWDFSILRKSNHTCDDSEKTMQIEPKYLNSLADPANRTTRDIWRVQKSCHLVDRPAYWTNQSGSVYLSNFIEQIVLPKKISPTIIRQKYLKSDLSASQLAGELGVSKQMILKQLRREGVRKTIKGRSPDNYRLPNPPYGYQVRDLKLISCPREMKIARMVVWWGLFRYKRTCHPYYSEADLLWAMDQEEDRPLGAGNTEGVGFDVTKNRFAFGSL